VEVGKDRKQIEKARAEGMIKDRHAIVVNEKVLLSDKELKARIAELEKANAELNRRILELEDEKAALSDALDSLSDEDEKADLDSLSDEALKERYREVIGANPGSRKRETLIAELEGAGDGA
jgi:S-adenosylmethionine:tRNA-ribosyltransferase-isomerase (queuine synthetase)